MPYTVTTLVRVSRRGNVLVATLMLFGIVILLTSVILAHSTLSIRKQLNSTTTTKQSDLTQSALAWLTWRGTSSSPDALFTGMPITGPLETKDFTGTWTLNATSFDQCTGIRTLRLDTQTGLTAPVVQRRVQAQTPLYSSAALMVDDALTLPAGTTINGWVHANGSIQSAATHDGLVESAADITLTGKSPLAISKPNSVFIPLSPSLPSLSDIATIANRGKQLFMAADSTRGFHVHLNGTNLVISRVVKTESRWGYDDVNKWISQDEVIIEEQLDRSIKLDETNCTEKNVFAFDRPVWIDGTTERSITVLTVASSTSKQTNSIIINGAITTTGSAHIGLVSANNIVIPLHAPDALTIDAALYTPNGGLLRRHYCAVGVKGQPARCDKSYAGSMIRSSVTIFGSLASKYSPKWQWEEKDAFVSGYQTATILQDMSLLDNPPPFFPRRLSPAIVTLLPNE